MRRYIFSKVVIFLTMVCASITTIFVHAQTSDNLLQSDNIFDTLSVDLKVNGSDGPVNVAAGERITISWESDGAKRCKGNWSKNDLRLNGKISGKLSRSLTGSVTVRIACIDADGNREDDSVVLKITNSVTPPSPLPPPPTDQPIIISSCGEITTGGKYILDKNLISTGGICVNVHHANNVDIDCDGHSITSDNEDYAMYFWKVSHFSASNCKIIPAVNRSNFSGKSQHLFRVFESTNGKLSGINADGVFLISISESSNITFTKSILRRVQYQVYRSHSIVTSENTFTSVPEVDSGIQLHLQEGSHNSVLNNVMDGGSDGVYHGAFVPENKGTDDNIVITDETNDLISGNTLKNVWDANIENSGFMHDTKIINNKMENAGISGIGGWYWNSMRGNLIKGNVVSNTDKLFYYFRAYSLRPNEKQVYFQDNVFEDNKLVNPRKGEVVNPVASQFTMEATDVPASSLMLGNNVFRDNDFTTFMRSVVFVPFSMIIDGGGNICAKSSDPNYPLACGR